MEFEAELERRGSGHVVRLPFDAREIFGTARAPVRVTVREHTFRTTTARYGGVDYIGLNRDVRDEAGVAAGERITVRMELDTEPRVVEVPGELAHALSADSEAQAAFDALSYTHRKEYARWIEEAKREETRTRRVAQAIAMLRKGVATPG